MITTKVTLTPPTSQPGRKGYRPEYLNVAMPTAKGLVIVISNRGPGTIVAGLGNANGDSPTLGPGQMVIATEGQPELTLVEGPSAELEIGVFNKGA